MQFKSDVEYLPLFDLNTILYRDPMAKISFMAYLLQTESKVIYIDLDTLFTSYIKNKILEPRGSLEIFLPDEDSYDLKRILSEICSIHIDTDLRYIVFDSLDTFYIMYKMNGSLNHLFSMYVSLLQSHARKVSAKILLTRKSNKNNRFIDAKSKVILDLKLESNKLFIDVLKHPNEPKKFSIDYENIPLKY